MTTSLFLSHADSIFDCQQGAPENYNESSTTFSHTHTCMHTQAHPPVGRWSYYVPYCSDGREDYLRFPTLHVLIICYVLIKPAFITTENFGHESFAKVCAHLWKIDLSLGTWPWGIFLYKGPERQIATHTKVCFLNCIYNYIGLLWPTFQ